MNWFDQAACIGQADLFTAGDHTSMTIARAICAQCPVRIECLNYALAHEKGGDDRRAGMYGGLTPTERAAYGESHNRCQECWTAIRPSRRFCDPCRAARRAAQKARYETRRRHEQSFSDAAARRAHADYVAGKRDELTIAGQRVYDRRRKAKAYAKQRAAA